MITILYYIAAFSGGWMVPELFRMVSPRKYDVPIPMLLICGFIACMILHANLN